MSDDYIENDELVRQRKLEREKNEVNDLEEITKFQEENNVKLYKQSFCSREILN